MVLRFCHTIIKHVKRWNNDSKQGWQEYEENLMQSILANGNEEAGKKRAVLLSVIGPGTYKLFRNLLSLDNQVKKSMPKSSPHWQHTLEIVQWHKFKSPFHNQGESVVISVAELRSLVEHCNFGQTLKVTLHDCIVYGISDGAIQQWFLSEKE